MTIRWEGVDEFEKWLKVTPGLVAKDVAGGLNEEGEQIMAAAKRDTPVDTGRLRSTGHVKPPSVRRGLVETVLAFGTDYAIFVHEISASHPSGRSKFLEANVNAAARGFGGRLMSRIKRRLR
jgi:hypothetical protein